MKPRIYIETTIVSYLTSRPNRDLVIAAHQQITHEWWDRCRPNYDLFISQLVQKEAAAGDAQAAQERLDVLKRLNLLEISDEAGNLADELIRAGALPVKAADDALHIAISAINRIPYLLTWNCRHLANATMRPTIESVCVKWQVRAPIICTPEELLAG